MKTIVHVDMDAFYASVEQRDDPSLKGREVIVGGHARRGVVLAASYEVRPKGVRSAMPMAKAVKLAPQAMVVPPRFTAYVEASEAVFDIFHRYTPLVEPLSLDEAFLDVTASRALFGTGAEIARKIREDIRREVRLPSSAGIAETKFVAKVASDLAKPDGQREVPPGESAAFLAPLPVGRLFGVGPKTEQRLQRQGLRTIGDIANLPEDRAELIGVVELQRLARGLDERVVVPDRDAKSIGAEDTFEFDLGTKDALLAQIHAQAWRVARRLRRAGYMSRVVVLKLKTARFEVMTRRRTIPDPTDDGQVLFEVARDLLELEWPLKDKVRLTGVSAHELTREAQLALLGPTSKGRRINEAIDAIAAKFGSAAVVSADQITGETRRGRTAPRDDDDEARRKVGAANFDAVIPNPRRR